MKKLNRIVAIIPLVSCFLISTATNFVSASNKNELAWGQIKMDLNLDSTQTTFWEPHCISDTIFETLANVDSQTGKLTPCLIEKMPESSEDGQAYTFTLKKDVKFHDGAELTAKDIKFSFERVLNPNTHSPYYEHYSIIKGAKEIISGATNSLSGLEIIDDFPIISLI